MDTGLSYCTKSTLCIVQVDRASLLPWEMAVTMIMLGMKRSEYMKMEEERDRKSGLERRQ